MVSEAARKKADEVKAELTAGNYVIFKGPIADNKGNDGHRRRRRRAARPIPNWKRWTIWSRA